MWPYKKKKKESAFKGTIGLEILTSWRNDKDEVIIFTKDRSIKLDENSELYLNIEINSAQIKLKIIPDFQKKELGFIEVLDPNTVGIKTIKFDKMIFQERKISIFEQLRWLDKDLEDLDNKLKKLKRIRNVSIIICIISTLINIFIFLMSKNVYRYINLIFAIFGFLAGFYVIYKYNKAYKFYIDIRNSKSELFSIVKET
jgi:hypothetical protein